MESDDLAPLIVPHHSADSGPTPAFGSEEPARFGQGTILTWDQETFANTVRFRGTVLADLPVMAGTDALTFQPGDKVGIQYWAPAGGSGVYWILPRIIVPGSGAAEQAIAALTTDLGRAVAASVFADRIQIATDAGQTITSSTSFGDGTSAGPVVSGVQITAAGVAIAFLGCRIDALSPTDGTQVGGNMSVVVSGATSVAASINTAVDLGSGLTITGADEFTQRAQGRVMVAHTFTGLNPGEHTFTGKYASRVGGQDVTFDLRSIIVIAF